MIYIFVIYSKLLVWWFKKDTWIFREGEIYVAFITSNSIYNLKYKLKLSKLFIYTYSIQRCLVPKTTDTSSNSEGTWQR